MDDYGFGTSGGRKITLVAYANDLIAESQGEEDFGGGREQRNDALLRHPRTLAHLRPTWRFGGASSNGNAGRAGCEPARMPALRNADDSLANDLLVEEILAARLVVIGQRWLPGCDDVSRRNSVSQLLHGFGVPEQSDSFGNIKILRRHFV